MVSITNQNSTNHENVTVFQLRGDYGSLDDAPIDKIDAALSEHVDCSEHPRVVLDLTETRFFGVDFVNVLEQVSSRVSARDGHMALCGLTPFCAEVIRSAQLDQPLASHTTRDEAVAAVSDA